MRWRLWMGLLASVVTGGAIAAEFYSTSDPAVLYDAPSLKSRPLFVVGREVPLELIVSVEGWLKVRDSSGSVAWVERKAVTDRRMLTVRTANAEVLAAPDASAAVVFKADQNVLLELADAGYATTTPGWVKVRHRDGQIGYIRIAQVWGL
jgi:SH3-like domain-containing protein